MKKYCVYEHIDKKLNIPFYVGSGLTKTRPYSTTRNEKWIKKVKEIGSFSESVEVRIIKTFDSKEEALSSEVNLIRKYLSKNIDLTNISIGNFHAKETKEKISRKNLGMESAFKGRKHTNKSLKLLSENAAPRRPEVAKKISIAKMGRNHPKSKTVLQIDPKNNIVIREFESTRDVQRKIGIGYKRVQASCKDERIVDGFIYQYK